MRLIGTLEEIIPIIRSCQCVSDNSDCEGCPLRVLIENGVVDYCGGIEAIMSLEVVDGNQEDS